MRDVNYIHLIQEGLTSQIAPLLKERIVDKLVEDFRKQVDTVVSDEIAKMCFDIHASHNSREFRDEVHVIIKDTKEYISKYSMQKEVLTKND